jgi:amino acid transporter
MATSANDERDPLIQRVSSRVSDEQDIADTPPSAEQVFQYDESRKLGVTSSIFLIVNKMIGTGIFSTPSGIYKATGSVAGSLVLWVVGGLLTFTGLSVFLEFGLGIPRSGGEKNYLERVYRRPKYLATSILLTQMVLLGFSAGNSFAFGRYVLLAAGYDNPNDWVARGVATGCVSFAVFIHSVFPKWGMRLFNILGIFKIGVLLLIVFSGFAVLTGHVKVPEGQPKPHNFNAVTVYTLGTGGVYNYATSLLRVIFSYKGWENANYVLSEVKNPRKTLSIAAPIAIGSVVILYVLANVAYFAAIPSDDLANSGVIVAGLFFRNVFGNTASARILPLLVAMSNIGNVLAVSFGYSRVNQELAKEGILPFSEFFASNKPFNSPAAALFLHWIVTVVALVAPPPGEVYEFIVDLYTYPVSWINGSVTAGLLYLHWNKSENWSSPWRSFDGINIVYLLSNIFLAVVPFIPPKDGYTRSYPYYVFPLVGTGVLLLGVVYWVVWIKLLPRLGRYKIVSERMIDEQTGGEVVRYKKVKVS